MQAFNLTRVNLHSPYAIWLDANILLYQCETGDNRQTMRARLFTRWFNEYDKRERFCVKVSVLRDEDVDNYIALIVQKSNPKLESILQDFEDFIGFFGAKPE